MSINSNSTNLQLDTKRHSFVHLMAAAVGKMFPEAQFGVGPVIENGCYYDFVLPRNFVPEDLPLLENHIKEMVKEHLSFKVQEFSIEEAIIHFEKANQPLKIELLENLRDRGTTSMSEEEKADFGDENYSTLFEKVKTRNLRRVNVGFVINNFKNQILMAKRSSDKKTRPNIWHIPGGKMEVGENFEQAIRRELKEELDLDLIKVKSFTNCTWNMFGVEEGNNIDEDTYYFEIEAKGDITLNYENTEFGFFDLAHAQNLEGITKTELEVFNNINKNTTPKITLYRIVNEKTGEILFEDLCKGPHVYHVKELRGLGFKLDKFSASYWRGDQARGINMQRLYALVYETKEELKSFIDQREEAKKRDHRVLGQQMKLFTISEMVGAGLTLMQPKGTIIRNLLQQYLWQIHKPHGYQQLWTPHIAKEELYIKSGHAGHYLDDMFSVYGGTSKEKFYLKPMNCPHHMQVFADNQFSYRDMPVRYFEPATVYRDEKTGQLSGLARVRNITQDDGHVFCRIGGIQAEVTIFANAVKQFYATMGMEADWVSLSVRDATDRSKYLGTDENWDIAEKALEDAAIANGFNYRRVEGEAAFYGPKLDFMFKDCLGRQWQLSTIQCDFNLPERFDLSFKNENSEDERPVVLHRAVAGSYERFMGIMIENYAGKFPFWLAPEQIRILTINDAVLPYVDKVKAELNKVVLMQPLKYNEIRHSVDDRMETLGKKIRDAKLDKIPMLMIVGPKDVEAGEVSIEYNGESLKVKLGELKEWMEGVK